MYAKVNLEDLDARETEQTDPAVKAVGYELRPSEMRPNVWIYAPGQSNNRHKQAEQEELYYVIDGTGTMAIEDETIDISPGDCIVVQPDAWRQIRAETHLEVLVVGAPNVKDDGIHEAGN